MAVTIDISDPFGQKVFAWVMGKFKANEIIYRGGGHQIDVVELTLTTNGELCVELHATNLARYLNQAQKEGYDVKTFFEAPGENN